MDLEESAERLELFGGLKCHFISTNTSEDPGQPLNLREKGNDIIKIKLQELEK